VEVNRTAPGVNFREQYEIPVYQVEMTPEQTALAQQFTGQAAAVFAKQVSEFHEPTKSRIKIRELHDGKTEFYFPPCRNLGTAFSTVVMMAFFSVFIALCWGKPGFGGSVIIGFCGLVDLILGYGVLRILFGSYHTVVTPEAVRVSKRLFGLGGTRTIPAAEIVNITIRNGLTSGKVIFYDIAVILKDGNSVTTGSMMRNKVEASYLAKEMKRVAGLDHRSKHAA
jgi:hypothetical protein